MTTLQQIERWAWSVDWQIPNAWWALIAVFLVLATVAVLRWDTGAKRVTRGPRVTDERSAAAERVLPGW